MPFKLPWRLPSLRRALIEMAFIIFLFYSNLLMGEYTHGRHPGVFHALADIFTLTNSVIAFVAAAIAYGVFEWWRIVL